MHDSVQNWIHCRTDDTNPRGASVQVKVQLCVVTKHTAQLHEKKRRPERRVHDRHPETQLGDVSLISRPVYSFHVGAKRAECVQVHHGCNHDRKAVERAGVGQEGLGVAI